jgi:hypothetical protein
VDNGYDAPAWLFAARGFSVHASWEDGVGVSRSNAGTLA